MAGRAPESRNLLSKGSCGSSFCFGTPRPQHFPSLKRDCLWDSFLIRKKGPLTFRGKPSYSPAAFPFCSLEPQRLSAIPFPYYILKAVFPFPLSLP